MPEAYSSMAPSSGPTPDCTSPSTSASPVPPRAVEASVSGALRSRRVGGVSQPLADW